MIPCPEAGTELRKRIQECLNATNNVNKFDDDDVY